MPEEISRQHPTSEVFIQKRSELKSVESMEITFNGNDVPARMGLSVAELMQAVIAADGEPDFTGAPVSDDSAGFDGAGFAVAVNESVIPRSQWGSTVISVGSRVEVLTAVQGG